ncbi:exopolyphosphatase [Micromonospora sp. LOL_024]|uniref:Ppx/GppA phosphatase family protein n=1 Tax=Micromonospora sp. LOL_024 TaxID=3345412 RepID=UPI003A88B21F
MAAIDCGTNSIRLLVADLPDPAAGPTVPLVDLCRRMEIVRLGQGVDATGRLAPEAIERTRIALADYVTEIEKLDAKGVRMCATSATRDAENAAEFRTMVEQTLGVTPEVVSGDEEARLSFAGAVRGLPADATSPYLVVDIGGGSTEFVVGRETGVDAAISVDVGCVRMTERHLHGDPPGLDETAAAQADISAAVDRALAAVRGREAATLVGLAGSVTTVVAIAQGLTGYDPARIQHARVSYERVAEITADLLAMTREQRLAIPVMHPGRADVIGAGALVLRVIMERAGLDAVVASEHDILDGIAWSLARPT